MRSWEVQGRSWAVPGAQGVPLGAPGLDFGPPWAPFWAPFWSHFWYVLSYFFRSDFWIFFSCSFGCFRRPFWGHFEGVWWSNFDIKSVTFSRTSPERMWEPRVATTGSKSWIFIGGLFKIEGRPFRVGVPPGAAFEAKLVPEWRSELTKTC